MWQTEEATRCPDCGTYPHEHEAGEEVWEPDINHCLGCEAIETLRAKVTDEHEPQMIRGWKLRLYRKGVDDGD